MKKNRQMFGYLQDSYYAMNDGIKKGNSIVIPTYADYKSKGIMSRIINDNCEIDIFNYHSDLVTESNSERVEYMKEFIIDNKIENIKILNDKYIISIEYELYNKNNELIKTGKVSVNSKWYNAIINNDINCKNEMLYREALIFTSMIEIQIPQISRYGIKNEYIQYPYTIKIKSVSVSAVSGNGKYIEDDKTQYESKNDCDNCYHKSHADYYCSRHDGLCRNNYNSCFITNAHWGTTIIDSVVVPAELETPEDIDLIPLFENKIDDKDFTLKINQNINLVKINIEILFDNMNVCYDVDDIKEMINIVSSDNFNNDHCCCKHE